MPQTTQDLIQAATDAHYRDDAPGATALALAAIAAAIDNVATVIQKK